MRCTNHKISADCAADAMDRAQHKSGPSREHYGGTSHTSEFDDAYALHTTSGKFGFDGPSEHHGWGEHGSLMKTSTSTDFSQGRQQRFQQRQQRTVMACMSQLLHPSVTSVTSTSVTNAVIRWHVVESWPLVSQDSPVPHPRRHLRAFLRMSNLDLDLPRESLPRRSAAPKQTGLCTNRGRGRWRCVCWSGSEQEKLSAPQWDMVSYPRS
jgi:hypothetical protein